MLDIQTIRDNPEAIKQASVKKNHPADVERLLAVDAERRELLQQVEEQRAAQNTISKDISQAKGKPDPEAIKKSKQLKAHIAELDDQLKPLNEEFQKLMLQVPQIPHSSVPDGDSDEQNEPVKHWGDKPDFDFKPKDHVELMLAAGMVDFERGAKMHGFRGYYLLADGARLCWAIWNYANDFFQEKGFVPMLPPAIVREEHLYGTGHLPNEVEDVYATQDQDYLVGTAEIPVTGYHAGETLAASDLPKQYLGFSPCYRREAGSYGRDTKGLIRVNEFYKVEQVVLCEATEAETVKWHEQINQNTEQFIESLNIPYRTVVNCGGDLGQGQVKKYDIELWVPLEEKYREISSASYFNDFQARRFNIRYKDAEGATKFVYTLNSTAIPTPRILVSLVENFQDKNGAIQIPKPLQKYMGGQTEIKVIGG